jgi:transposase
MAYGSRENRNHLRKRKIKAVIPEKSDYQANRRRKGSRGGRPISFDAQQYKRRNLIERCNQKLKSWRGIATRYDKLPEMFEGGINLAASAPSHRWSVRESAPPAGRTGKTAG